MTYSKPLITDITEQCETYKVYRSLVRDSDTRFKKKNQKLSRYISFDFLKNRQNFKRSDFDVTKNSVFLVCHERVSFSFATWFVSIIIVYTKRCSVKNSTICTGDKKINKRNRSFVLCFVSIEI